MFDFLLGVKAIEMRMSSAYPSILLSRLSKSTLQLAAAAAAIVLYGAVVVPLKWWVYPGWTWRGYLADLEALIGLAAFALGFGLWVFQAYRSKTVDAATRDQIRHGLQSTRLPVIVLSLVVVGFGLLIALLTVGERRVAVELLDFAQQSNWTHARDSLANLSREPLRPELFDTLRVFVTVHELSERDRLKESRSLREDRNRVAVLMQAGHDYDLLNSLTYAELSKAIHFVEDAEGSKRRLDEGIEHLLRRESVLADSRARARILARIGELRLAAREYETARAIFQQALALEDHPTRAARLRANLGNTYAATRDLSKAADLYAQAEADYPEGRRSIFYSNFGYLLMLSKQYDAAKQKVERAIQIDASDWYSYLNLGLIKEALGEFDDAYESFKRVINNSENPDSRREARILAGRCLELAGRAPNEYLPLYLEADGRSTSSAQVARLQRDPRSLAALYAAMAKHLQDTNTHAIEDYIEWFSTRAKQVAATL